MNPYPSDNARFKGLRHMVGNTPLLKIRYRDGDREGSVFAKAENLNMTGSIKDRMAYVILENAYREGRIDRGHRIAEATSGNTGISISAIGRALGHSVTIFMPNWMSEERKRLIQSLGAEIRLVSREEGGFLGSIQMAEEMAKQSADVFLPRQFANEANVDAHRQTTGPEIWWQCEEAGCRPDAFVAGVGTGGTLMGVGHFLKEQSPSIKVHPLQPAESPTLSVGRKVGHHRIQGISDEFIPPICKLESVDEIVSVHDGDAILMAQKMATELGLGVGISSGANVVGAILLKRQLDAQACVVTVLPDDNKKYLSTDLLREEPLKKDFVTPTVELLEFEVYRRVCRTCVDRDECDRC